MAQSLKHSLLSALMALVGAIVIGVFSTPVVADELARKSADWQSTPPDMVLVPAGTFQMGDIQEGGIKDEQPVHEVRIAKPFALGRYEVTFEEYDRFAKRTGHKLPDDRGWGRGRRPVIGVSWDDAVAYAKWLSQQTGKRYRLPTEAEWEYAARSGGKEELWAGTSRKEELGDYAWYSANSGGRTHDVGRKKPNGLGVYDMSGNVWEWVQDCWHVNYKGAPKNGTAWEKEGSGNCGLRVIRGASSVFEPRGVRSSNRDVLFRDSRDILIGFRLAQDID